MEWDGIENIRRHLVIQGVFCENFAKPIYIMFRNAYTILTYRNSHISTYICNRKYNYFIFYMFISTKSGP